MDRTPWYPAEGVTSFDLNNVPKDALKGFGLLVPFFLGEMAGYVWGFGATQTTTPSMNIALAEGQIYVLHDIDDTPIGTLPADDYPICQQGWTDAQEVALNTASIGIGESQWWLIQVEFEQRDEVREGDPAFGSRGFYNSTDLSQPLDGIDGLGGITPSVRRAFAKVSAVAGVSATTGTEVPPDPSSGCLPLYLIKLTHGQSVITTGQIEVAGSAAYSGYPEAPFIAGLLNQHHRGTTGHAPQIVLGGVNKEVQGVMDRENLPVTNATSTDDNIKIPTIREASGIPQGAKEGFAGDLYIDLDTGILWSCSVSGDSSTAVWSPYAPIGITVIDTFPANITATSGIFALKLSPSDTLAVVNLPSAADPCNLRFVRYDSNFDCLAVLTANGSDEFFKDGVTITTSANLTCGEACNIVSVPDDTTWIWM